MVDGETRGISGFPVIITMRQSPLPFVLRATLGGKFRHTSIGASALPHREKTALSQICLYLSRSPGSGSVLARAYRVAGLSHRTRQQRPAQARQRDGEPTLRWHCHPTGQDVVAGRLNLVQDAAVQAERGGHAVP